MIGKMIKGETFFTSDTHFGHAKIIGYCNRPYRCISQMDNILIDNWNSSVGPNDTVIHLGDCSFVSDQYIHRLNGNIILVKGNHDNNKHHKLFTGVIEFMPIVIGDFNCLLTHRPVDPDGAYKSGREPVHEKWKTKGKNVNVGVDVWEMRPIHIDTLIDFLKSLEEI
jgi:calcineurin-like phosphoesterase family protein